MIILYNDKLQHTYNLSEMNKNL